jgi:hypothetical protein
MVRPASSSTLSKIRLAALPGNVKWKIATWSVGAISVRMPSSNLTL